MKGNHSFISLWIKNPLNIRETATAAKASLLKWIRGVQTLSRLYQFAENV